MAAFLQLSVFTSLSIMFACGLSVQFGDAMDAATNDVRNDFEIKLAVLEQKVIEESVEIQQWRLRIAELEKHLTEAKDEKIEGMSTILCHVLYYHYSFLSIPYYSIEFYQNSQSLKLL